MALGDIRKNDEGFLQVKSVNPLVAAFMPFPAWWRPENNPAVKLKEVMVAWRKGYSNMFAWKADGKPGLAGRGSAGRGGGGGGRGGRGGRDIDTSQGAIVLTPGGIVPQATGGQAGQANMIRAALAAHAAGTLGSVMQSDDLDGDMYLGTLGTGSGDVVDPSNESELGGDYTLVRQGAPDYGTPEADGILANLTSALVTASRNEVDGQQWTPVSQIAAGYALDTFAGYPRIQFKGPGGDKQGGAMCGRVKIKGNEGDGFTVFRDLKIAGASDWNTSIATAVSASDLKYSSAKDFSLGQSGVSFFDVGFYTTDPDGMGLSYVIMPQQLTNTMWASFCQDRQTALELGEYFIEGQ